MRHYERAYDEQLIAFREDRADGEDYPEHVMIEISALIARGENVEHIASLLGLDEQVVLEWYRDIFLNQQDLAFSIDEFTYIREKNLIRPDARTKGCIVKAIIEEQMTPEAAAEAVGVSSSQVVTKWITDFGRDCEIMTTLPAGIDYKIRTAYAYNREHAEELQELIFRHDKEENELASQRREEYIASR